MHVLIVDPTSKIPQKLYGGTERIIWDLGYCLQLLGHKVTFLVKAGSTSDFANVIEFDPNQKMEDQFPRNIDLIHFHRDTIASDIPNLTTLHGNTLINQQLPVNTVFLSKKHASLYGSKRYVYNGLNWDNYPKNALDNELNHKREHCHFLGKASWKFKNVDGAIEIAIKAGQKLEILGGEKWTFRNLKKNTFQKLHPKISYHGLVDNNYKSKIIQKSKGLIFPILWNEPFGLAVIESLYFGAPVYGTPYGALQELVLPEFGHLSTKKDELIYALKNSSFSHQKCHEYARDCFNAMVMTKKYLELYELVLNNESLNPKAPTCTENLSLLGMQ